MKGRFSEESREPSTNIKVHKKSGSKAFSFLSTNETWENKWEANAVYQINETRIYKPKLLWTVLTSELLPSLSRDTVKNQRTALIFCTKVSAFSVLCPFLNVYSLKGRLKNGVLCIFIQILLTNNHWKPVTSHSSWVFRCHHRDLTEQAWRKAKKQHLWQQVSQPKKAASPFSKCSLVQ